MTYIDVLEAIAGRVASLWPERMLYRDFCPADHKRPSGFLYVISIHAPREGCDSKLYQRAESLLGSICLFAQGEEG